jgi:hypothetical protein
MVKERAELVTRLVQEGPLSEADMHQLLSFGWDSDESLVVLTRVDATAILRRHLDGELSADDVVRWANQVEARDDVDFEAAYEQALRDLIFELANPDLHVDPTSAAAERWLAALR